jgi:AcrR family transcriptional regulator
MPKIVDHEQYRKELLHKCFDLFADKGYASITMRQIAQGLGVSTGTLYHYFPSKESLFEQLVDEISQRDLVQFEQEIEQKQSLEERIVAAIAFIQNNEDYFFKQIMLWTEYYRQHGSEQVQQNEVFQRIAERESQSTIKLLELGDDPQIYAFLDCWYVGLLMQRMYRNLPVDYEAQTRILFEFLNYYTQKN